MRTLKLLLLTVVLSMPFYSCVQESVEPDLSVEISEKEFDNPGLQGSDEDGDR